jgi:hypothetical protein
MEIHFADIATIIVALIGLVGTIITSRRAKEKAGRAKTARSSTLAPSLSTTLFMIVLAVGIVGFILAKGLERREPAAGPRDGGAALLDSPVVEPASSASVRITYPAAGAVVEEEEVVQGTSGPIPPADSLWVVVFIPSVARYFPQDNPVDMQAGGGWNALTRLGVKSDAGMRFQVLIVAADARARAAFRQYLAAGAQAQSWVGMQRLPEGAVEHHRVTVTRG